MKPESEFGLKTKLGRIEINEHVFISIVAILIGVAAGYGAVIFRFAIKGAQYLFYQNTADFLEFQSQVPIYLKILLPGLGGLIVGPMIYYWAREAKGHGVPEVMEAVAIKGGRIRPRVSLVKILASGISIGCGGSVGREGPMVQIGASVASTVGQLLKVTQDRQRTLVGCGAAAGIAATFNAPIAGVLFSVEILLSDFGVATFSPIVLSSVMATTISRHFFGDFPAFIVPHYELVSYWEFFFYGIIGLFTALVSILFIKCLYKSEDMFEALPLHEVFKTALGGMMAGCIIVVFPHVFGVGYGAINQSLMGHMTVEMLFILIFVKIIATSITLGGGMSGGILAPSIFIGAMTGGFFGSIFHQTFPEITASSGAYALVAMGGLVAGTTQAPITAILIIFELTSDYKIILPLMTTCIISALLSTYLQEGSIYTIKLMRRGISLYKGMEQSVLRNIYVRNVMREDVVTIPEDVHLEEIFETFKKHNVSYLPVVNHEGDLAGIISFRDLRAVLNETSLRRVLKAKDLATKEVITVSKGENLKKALQKMGQKGVSQLPVVSDENPKKLVGMIHDKDIIAAYNRETLRFEW